jgi:hypothetical protein
MSSARVVKQEKLYIHTVSDAARFASLQPGAQGYCLKARGTIVNGATGARINFTHDQIYSPPAPCDNAALKNQR